MKKCDKKTSEASTGHVYFEFVRESGDAYVFKDGSGKLHPLKLRTLRTTDKGFKKLINPRTHIETLPECLRQFATAFARAALSFIDYEESFAELKLNQYLPNELHSGSWIADIANLLLKKADRSAMAPGKIAYDACARFKYGKDSWLMVDFECDSYNRPDQMARLCHYHACAMASSMAAGLKDYRFQIPCLVINVSATTNIVTSDAIDEAAESPSGIYLIGPGVHHGNGAIETKSTIMVIQLPEVARFLTQQLKASREENIFERLPNIFQFAAWFCGLSELDRLLNAYPLFSNLKEFEMKNLGTDKNLVSEYNDAILAQESIELHKADLARSIELHKAEIERKDAALASKDAALASQSAEITSQRAALASQSAEIESMALRFLRSLQGKSDAEIMQSTGWTLERLNHYRALATAD